MNKQLFIALSMAGVLALAGCDWGKKQQAPEPVKTQEEGEEHSEESTSQANEAVATQQDEEHHEENHTAPATEAVK